MSYRPRGIIAMMTLAGRLAGLSRKEGEGDERKLRSDLSARAASVVQNHYAGWSRGRPSQKAQLKKLRKRRNQQKMARLSRRVNRHV